MAFTKLYLTTATAPYTPATLRGAWNDTAGAVTRALEPIKTYGGTLTTIARAETNAAANHDVLLYRGVSGPLAAQTISGTVDVVLGVLESNAAADFAWHIHIYVSQGDSDTPRGTLLNDYVETTANEWPTTATGRALAAAQTLTNIGAITAGDRLVVEIGYVALNAVATSYTGTLNYGTQLPTTGAEAPDLAAAGTDVTVKAGFLQFSVSVTESELATRVTSAPTLVTANGTGAARISSTPTLVTAGGTGAARVSSTPVLVTTAPVATARITAAFVLVTMQVPPLGGGGVPPGTNPPSAPVPVGVVRMFGMLTYGGSPQTELKVSETALSDPVSWYGGFGHPVLLSLSSYTRELTDGVRAVEVRVELADTDRRFRTLAATDTLGGATWEHFLVSDTVRYALGEPHRRFCGRVHEHRALPGFRYELLVRDVLSEEMASLSDAPRIPQKLGLVDLPGMSAEYEGLALQIAIGALNDEVELATPQGVVPPLVVAPLINFQTAFGGIDQDVIATVVTHGALGPTGVWRVFYNTPTDPYARIEVPTSAWGTLLWAPGQAGWADTGLANDYADYPADPAYTNRLTPFYIAADHANSTPFLDGRILVGINLYGVTENADGTGLYLSDAPRVYQWLLSNFLYRNWKTGAYNDPPTFVNGVTIINTDSVETTVTRLRGFLGGGADAYPVGFLIGRGGQQQTLRHILGELCHGVAMEQGTDRHGRIMLDVEDVDAVATITLSDLLDIETGAFEVWVDRSSYRNCLEYVHGYRYVPAVAPLPAPPEGETLPVKPLGPHADWTSGLVKLEHADAIAANGGRRTPPMQLENYVVRAPTVGADWAGRLLARAVGPSPSFDGPRMFRLTTSWQALGVELGTVIAIDHIEGLGATGYEGQRARVLKITDDLQRARIVLEGRVLFSGGSP